MPLLIAHFLLVSFAETIASKLNENADEVGESTFTKAKKYGVSHGMTSCPASSCGDSSAFFFSEDCNLDLKKDSEEMRESPLQK